MTKKKTLPHKKSGRPSKKTDLRILMKVFMLSRKGLTDKEIAEVIEVCEDTIHNWKSDPRFFESLKDNKEYADQIVERSLFERAVGYSCPETQYFSYKGEIISEEAIKHYPPSEVAAIFWLKNRKAKEWRDKQEIDHGFNDEVLEKYREMGADELIKTQQRLAREIITASRN